MAQMMQKTANGGLSQMKKLVSSDAMLERAKNTLGSEKAARVFLNSVLSLYGNDKLLTDCDPNAVMVEAMKAASLNLPVSKSLGFAYIIAYKNKGVPEPQFQLGYRGLIQLAQRSGQYKYINAGAVYEGMKVKTDMLSGMVEITGEAKNENVIGYFGYFELLNGFKKAVYWTKEQVEQHAKKYSRAWTMQNSPWHTQFDAMAIKTVLKTMLTKYGILSIEMMDTVAEDTTVDEKVEAEVAANGNQTPITIEMVDEEPAAVKQVVVAADDEEAGF